MLHLSTIDPETLRILKSIQSDESFNGFILVGGTALALQIGHRISIDLDFFKFTNEPIDMVLDNLDQFGKIRITNRSKRILNLYIDDLKVDFVSYRYAYIKDCITIDGVKLASLEDIAAMKLSAITGRGSKKDFIDLFFLLEKFSLKEMMTFYREKFQDGSEFLVYKSLIYFEDAENEPMPIMLSNKTWGDIKISIRNAVKDAFP